VHANAEYQDVGNGVEQAPATITRTEVCKPVALTLAEAFVRTGLAVRSITGDAIRGAGATTGGIAASSDKSADTLAVYCKEVGATTPEQVSSMLLADCQLVLTTVQDAAKHNMAVASRLHTAAQVAGAIDRITSVVCGRIASAEARLQALEQARKDAEKAKREAAKAAKAAKVASPLAAGLRKALSAHAA
jgi:hypothetical protein